MNDKNHLLWIYNRMVCIHNENCDTDYMLKLRSIIDGLTNTETDYTGCHPEVAESLKRGEHVVCHVVLNGDSSSRKVKVIAFSNGEYVTDNIHAYPCTEYSIKLVETETRVIKHVPMMQGLIDRGYVAYSEGFCIDKDDLIFYCKQFKYCGKIPTDTFTWEPWMIEEVEI